MVVKFEGPDRKIIKKAQPLIVSILDLKKAFEWLLTHSWAWIEATRKDDVNNLEKNTDGKRMKYYMLMNRA